MFCVDFNVVLFVAPRENCARYVLIREKYTIIINNYFTCSWEVKICSPLDLYLLALIVP